MGYDPSIALGIARTATVRSVAGSRPSRLLSMDVFRGLVIVAMLLVNNIGDPSTGGYFWKHADWISTNLGSDITQWRRAFLGAKALGAKLWLTGQFPLFRHCTLADFVMPWFMLVIGVAIPFSVAAARARNVPAEKMWKRTIRRAVLLVVLGWAIDNSIAFVNWRHGADPSARFGISLGMDVLQLLGISYLLARLLFDLPAGSRLAVALALFLWHWMLLKFAPQGDVAAGTFTREHEAIGYIYSTWPIFRSVDLLAWFKPALAGRLTLNLAGILSVAPTAATMMLGTLIGDWLRQTQISPSRKATQLFLAGAICAAVGVLWAWVDLPFNKPRWTPCYLLYASGIGAILLSLTFWITDVRGSAWWTRPLVVFGVNSIAAYWLSIMAKVWLLNYPKIGDSDVAHWLIQHFQASLGAHAGSWAFTAAYVLFWWLVLDQLYRRKIFFKV